MIVGRRACEMIAHETTPQQRATETILQRALALGAQAVALTGSTVRARRTAMSDLDFMIVGERPDCGGVREDVDVYAAGADAFWERLLAGDDYIQWTLRFGWAARPSTSSRGRLFALRARPSTAHG